MNIKKVSITGFRSINSLVVTFEKDLSIFIGENDSGKTSLIDCLKIITQNRTPEVDDFCFGCHEIHLSIEIEDMVFKRSFQLEDGSVQELPLEVRATPEYLLRIKQEFESPSFIIGTPEIDEKIRNLGKFFGLVVRSNSNLENMKEGVIQQIDKCLSDSSISISNVSFPRFNFIQLDGKQFENISSFFKEVFLKERENKIWQEKIMDGSTIEEFVKAKIDSYSSDISQKIIESGVQDKIRLFINDLTEIRVEPIYQTRDLNIDAKVKFINNGSEINIQKKGDGTKRRISLALLDFKKDQAKVGSDESTIYLLDEPDTHLHVKAQIELLKTLQGFTEKGSQVIITTHSPFLMNSVKPNQIRLLTLDDQNWTVIKLLHENAELSSNVLQSIGVENVYLFFARTLIIVEGETEYAFISNHYLRMKQRTINTDLIKIINVEGIQNIYGFAKGLLEVHDPNRIFIVCDNELTEDMAEIISHLHIIPENQYKIGTKEFEDAFSDNTLYECWIKYHDEIGKTHPRNWTVDNIKSIRQDCLQESTRKFSAEIKQLNVGGKKFTKPIFGYALARFIEEKEVPLTFTKLFEDISK